MTRGAGDTLWILLTPQDNALVWRITIQSYNENQQTAGEAHTGEPKLP